LATDLAVYSFVSTPYKYKLWPHKRGDHTAEKHQVNQHPRQHSHTKNYYFIWIHKQCLTNGVI